MHELGVVFSIIKTVEEVAAENDVTEVSAVKLHLGEVSTVIPEYLTDCWNWAVKKTEIMKEARLDIEIIPAVTYCEDCQKEYPTVKVRQDLPTLRQRQHVFAPGQRIHHTRDRSLLIKKTRVVRVFLVRQ